MQTQYLYYLCCPLAAETHHCTLNIFLSSMLILFSPLGSFTDYPVKQNFAMAPMQLSPIPLQQQPPPHHMTGSLQHGNYGNGHMLDYLENQVRELDVGPLQAAPHSAQLMLPLQPQVQPQVQPQPVPTAVPYMPGPPSMLSALDELGVRGVERRVITLPPIVKRVPSFSSGRGPAGGDRARGGHALSSQSSGSTSRSAGGLPNSRGYRDASPPPRRGILRDYNNESEWEKRRGRTPQRELWNESGGSDRRRGGGSGLRSRSRDDVMEEPRSRRPKRERSFSPPRRRKEPWSSDDEDGGRKWSKGKDWVEKPPSYFSIENQRGHSNNRKKYHQFSVRLHRC